MPLYGRFFAIVAGMRTSAPALAIALLSACPSHSLRVAVHDTKVPTDDGGHVWSYRLRPADARPEIPPDARAVAFYVGGSGYERSVLAVTGAMAGFVTMGIPVVLLERRGIEPDGSSDPVLARRHADRPTRVADALAATRAHLAGVRPGVPVILVGESEGGAVAAAMARAEPRITHVILLGSGGGMTQAEELAALAEHAPESGYATPDQLEAIFAEIGRHPDSDREWLGHPYRRWSSYLWSRPLDDLLAASTQVFLAHGDRDINVPVGSARLVEEAFGAQGRGNQLRYREYAGLDHGFRDESGRSHLRLVERDVVEWLEKQGLLDGSKSQSK